ncbi:MAG: shikimate kinase [Bowdeniella nasicola]|nr:shikimate kinase [Bowdeniella nasicola]
MTVCAILLVGPPGSGKTTVGAALAERLGWASFDGEELCAREAGLPISDMVLEWGDDAALEFQLVTLERFCTRRTESFVLALPSGVTGLKLPQQKQCAPISVFLDVSLAVAFPRTGLNAPRPVGLVAPRALFGALLHERRPLYAEHADLIVEVGDHDVNSLVSHIHERLSNICTGFR